MPTEIDKAVGTGVADPLGKTTSGWERNGIEPPENTSPFSAGSRELDFLATASL
jgi:hypothetical protein